VSTQLPKDDSDLNKRQTERLRRFSNYLAKSHHRVRHEARQRQGLGKRRCNGAASLDDFDVPLEKWHPRRQH